MRILVLAPDCPFPPVGGGQLRIHHCLRALAHTHELTLVGFSWGTAAAAPPFPVRVIEVPWKTPPLYEQMVSEDEAVSRAAYTQLATQTREPFLVSYYQSEAMGDTLRGLAAERFDGIIIENSFMARFLADLPVGIPRVLILHNVLTLMEQRRAESPSPEERGRADVRRMGNFEKKAVAQCELCVAVSAEEAEAARTLLGAERVVVIPNGVDSHYFKPTEGAGTPGRLLFTGSMNYWPNVRAVQHFCREILPRIQASMPDAHLDIVGTSPVEEVRRLASAHVTVHGSVPDMRPYYREAAVVVAPLLDGGGTRLKILEASACGKAIVSTSVGAEGLGFCPGSDLLLADSPDAFADAVLELLGDERRRQQLGWAARKASLRFEWDVIGADYRRTIEDYFAPGRRAAELGYGPQESREKTPCSSTGA